MTVPELRNDIEQQLLARIQTQLARKPVSENVMDLQNEANTLRTLILGYETFMATTRADKQQ